MATADSSTDLAVFQLAALRAFSASHVSSSRGKLQALMSLEAVKHATAFPLDGLPSIRKEFSESNALASQKHNITGLNILNGIAQDGDDLYKRLLANADVPSNTEIQRTVDTDFPLQETKRKKFGNHLATVVSLSVQDHTVMVASETTEESLRHVSDKDAMALKDGYRGVVSGSQGEDLAVKDSISEETAIGKKRESLVESDDESVPSLQEHDFLCSNSDI